MKLIYETNFRESYYYLSVFIDHYNEEQIVSVTKIFMIIIINSKILSSLKGYSIFILLSIYWNRYYFNMIV